MVMLTFFGHAHVLMFVTRILLVKYLVFFGCSRFVVMLTFCGHAHVLWSCSCFNVIEQNVAKKEQNNSNKRAIKDQ